MSGALWISAIPAFAVIAAIVVVGTTFQSAVTIIVWLGLLFLGLLPSMTLTEMAEVELARGSAAGRFLQRSLVLGGAFCGSLLGASAIALTLGSMPTPLLWILFEVVGVTPAALTAAVLTARAHRLPNAPYSGPAIVIRRR